MAARLTHRQKLVEKTLHEMNGMHRDGSSILAIVWHPKYKDDGCRDALAQSGMAIRYREGLGMGAVDFTVLSSGKSVRFLQKTKLVLEVK